MKFWQIPKQRNCIALLLSKVFQLKPLHQVFPAFNYIINSAFMKLKFSFILGSISSGNVYLGPLFKDGRLHIDSIKRNELLFLPMMVFHLSWLDARIPLSSIAIVLWSFCIWYYLRYLIYVMFPLPFHSISWRD